MVTNNVEEKSIKIVTRLSKTLTLKWFGKGLENSI